MSTEQDLVAANHEASHFAAAVLDGFRVEMCTIDRNADDFLRPAVGYTFTSIPDDDPRPRGVRAAARARVALAGPMVEPGLPGQADSDRRNAEQYAHIALREAPGGLVPGWITERAFEVERIIRTEIFQRLLMVVSGALLVERSLDARACDTLVRSVPGATMANLRAREAA